MLTFGGGRVVRWSWVNFQCRGVLLVWIRVGQGPTALAAGAGGGCLDIFTLIYPFSPLSPSLWETTRYRLKYCLKRSLSPKPTNPSCSSRASDMGRSKKMLKRMGDRRHPFLTPTAFLNHSPMLPFIWTAHVALS